MHNREWSPYVRNHFSQEGEDLLLERIFSSQQIGFYLDIGAHHPERFSNTLWAYRRGWSGINLDASKASIESLRRGRSRDKNLWFAVTGTASTVKFYEFDESALNTTKPGRKDFIEGATEHLARIVEVPASPLASILEKNLDTENQVIDFMTLDVEGAELDVLASNDWVKFKPRVVVMEVLGKTLNELNDAPEVRFLLERDYEIVAMLYHSVIFVCDKELIDSHWGGHHRGAS